MVAYDYRDPIYGFITLNELEQKIVDSSPFQRLRRILQLGPTNLVYPTANHTRFEHSLGALHITGELFDQLMKRPDSREILNWSTEEAEENRKLLRLAALLHDVGHAPFSHATEDLFPDEVEHEEYTYRIVTETEIGGLIDEELGDGARIRVAEIATEKAKSASDSFLSEILTGDIGSDRIDYLARDSHHLGVAYGEFDAHRLLNTLFIRHNEEKDGPELALEGGGVHAIDGFLLARYFMFLDVYYHKTRRILDIHLTEFLKSWLPQNKFPSNLEAFVKLDDVLLIQALKDDDDSFGQKVLRRDFFRLCFETSDHPGAQDLVAFKWLKDEVYREFDAEHVRIDEAEKAPYRFSQPPIFVYTNGTYRSLIEHSPLTNALQTIRKQRIYSSGGLRGEVERFCQAKWDGILQDIPTG